MGASRQELAERCQVAVSKFGTGMVVPNGMMG